MHIVVAPGQEPVAGESFIFGLKHSTDHENTQKPIRARITVGGELRAILECPDPPCHEMQFEVHLNDAGRVLSVETSYSSSSPIAKTDFVIGQTRLLGA